MEQDTINNLKKPDYPDLTISYKLLKKSILV